MGGGDRMNPVPASSPAQPITTTLAASGPFSPWRTSNSTFAPSASFLKPSPAIAL